VAEDPRDPNAKALDELYGSDEAQREQERVRKEMLADFHAAFKSEAGERCLKWMRQMWGGFTFDPENARQDAFNQGQRHVVETIEQIIEQVDEGDV